MNPPASPHSTLNGTFAFPLAHKIATPLAAEPSRNPVACQQRAAGAAAAAQRSRREAFHAAGLRRLRAKARLTDLAPRSALAPCAGFRSEAGDAAAKAAATKSRAPNRFMVAASAATTTPPRSFPRARRGGER